MTAVKKSDHYKILGLPRSASTEEINQAYRTLAKKYHPDIPAGDEEHFKVLAEAYRVLRDPKERQKYNATLPGPAGDYLGSPAQKMLSETFFGFFLGIAIVYFGVIILSFFILDLFQFAGLSLAIIVYGFLFFTVLKKFIKAGRS